MADIGQVPITLLMDNGLIGAAPLQVTVADEAHVFRLRRVAYLRRLRECPRDKYSSRSNHECRHSEAPGAKCFWSHEIRPSGWLYEMDAGRVLSFHRRRACATPPCQSCRPPLPGAPQR